MGQGRTAADALHHLTPAVQVPSLDACADPGAERRTNAPVRPRWPGWLPFALLVLAGVLVRVVQLRSGLFEPHLFRQSQTLWPIRGYVRHGIDLSDTYLPVFGDTTNVPFELPLYQAIASIPASLGVLGVLTSARVVALVAFESSALLMANLMQRWSSRRAALVTLALFQFLPFGLQWGAAPLIDFFSLALGLSTVLLADVWLRAGRKIALVVGAITCWLTLLVKVTTFPTVGVLLLLSAALVLPTVGWPTVRRRGALFLGSGVGIGLVLLVAWTRYADSVKGSGAATEWITSSALTTWNFGDLAQRTSMDPYRTILGRVSQEITGPLLIGVVACLALVVATKRHRLLAAGLLASAVIPPLIFFNLFVVHDYYLIAIYAPLVALSALGIDLLADRMKSVSGALVATIATACLVLLTWSSPNGQVDLRSLDPVEAKSTTVDALRSWTNPDDQIVTVACDWDPSLLYLADREGLMITGHETYVSWEAIATSGSRFLVACNGDPYSIVPPSFRLRPTSQATVFTIEGWSADTLTTR